MAMSPMGTMAKTTGNGTPWPLWPTVKFQTCFLLHGGSGACTSECLLKGLSYSPNKGGGIGNSVQLKVLFPLFLNRLNIENDSCSVDN